MALNQKNQMPTFEATHKIDYILVIIFLCLSSFILFIRHAIHCYSRYLQHLERMDGQPTPSISDGPTENIPSIM